MYIGCNGKLRVLWVITYLNKHTWLPKWLTGKDFACQCRKYRFHPWVGKIPWRRKWQPTPLFLPGESHRQRSLEDYSPWGRKRVRPDWVTEPTYNLVTTQQKTHWALYDLHRWINIGEVVDSIITGHNRTCNRQGEARAEVVRVGCGSEVAQSCLTLCDPIRSSLPGFSVHGIFQATVLEWAAISFSRGSSPPRD